MGADSPVTLFNPKLGCSIIENIFALTGNTLQLGVSNGDTNLGNVGSYPNTLGLSYTKN
jgi:hypothetical protein